jgi:hypothetical protein
MAAFSNYLENKLIDHVFRAATFSKPSALYVSLHTADVTDAGTGTEVSGGAYARAQLDPSDTNWTATQGGTSGNSSGTGGHTDNADAVTFPAPSGANWGVVTHFGIWDASSSGNLLFHGALGTPKTINDGDAAPTFPIGDLDVTLA